MTDYTGMRFGRLQVLEYSHQERSPSGRIRNKWSCLCDCGNKVLVCEQELKRGHTKSCGCYQRERALAACTKRGYRHTKIYHTWLDIKQRCTNSRRRDFKNYGGRGITICGEWAEDFMNFYGYVTKLEHFGEPGYSIDRINVNGNYEPGNVRWADIFTQAANRRSNHYVIDTDGEELTISQYARKHGISYNRAYYLNGGKEKIYAAKKKRKEHKTWN